MISLDTLPAPFTRAGRREQGRGPADSRRTEARSAAPSASISHRGRGGSGIWRACHKTEMNWEAGGSTPCIPAQNQPSPACKIHIGLGIFFLPSVENLGNAQFQ